MGMAASQARFLQLTARKSNVEYEGQQVNQQRTTLSNQSANYYNQMLGLTVPTPPSSSDYTTTTYTFEDGSLTNTITALIAQSDGTYLVSYLQSYTDDYSVVSSGTAVVSRKITTTEDTDDETGETSSTTTYTYSIGGSTLRTLANTSSLYETDEEGNAVYDDDGNLKRTDYANSDSYLSTLSDDELEALAKEEEYYLTLLQDTYSSYTGNWYVRYVYNSTTSVYEARFYKASEVNDKDDDGNCSYNDSTGASQSTINVYTIGSSEKTSEVKAVSAALEMDSTGRIINISFLDDDGEVTGTYSVTTNTTTDSDAYDDAMNQYEYEKYEYDQTVQEINAKIEIIQAEDQTLELRLKQLDTEQDAIQTEIDSVTKVIEKNVESSFKTFA